MSDGKQLGNKVIGLDIGHSSVKVSAKDGTRGAGEDDVSVAGLSCLHYRR